MPPRTPGPTPDPGDTADLAGGPVLELVPDRTAGEPGPAEAHRSARAALAERTRLLLTEARSAQPRRRAELAEEVVTAHLWLADALARRYQRRGEELEDLVQVARSGLVEAVQRFDPDCGSFVAFAVPTISGVVKRHFRDHGWLVRPPRRTQELAAQVRQQWPGLVQELRADPTDSEVAGRVGHSVDAVREATRASQWYASASLDAALTAGASFPAAEAGAELELAEVRLILARAWPQLEPDERRLLVLRFYDDRSQSDIAARVGISQMQVSRLLARTLRRMRSIIAGSEPSPLAS